MFSNVEAQFKTVCFIDLNDFDIYSSNIMKTHCFPCKLVMSFWKTF